MLTLFCPNEERPVDEGPVLNNEDSGPKMVDLFTPEFCLKVGDTFVKIIQNDDETASKPAVVTKWLQKQRSQRTNNMEADPHQELTHLVTELIEQKET